MSDRIPAVTRALLTLTVFFVCATLGAGFNSELFMILLVLARLVQIQCH